VEFSKYKTEWLILIIAIGFAVLSFIIDLKSAEHTTWFARSGSFVVLLSVIVEFRLSKYVYEDVLQAAKKSIRKNGLKISDSPFVQAAIEANQTVKPEAPKSRKILRTCSHILVIAGTVVWGYGDIYVS
jgi:hypothetical protein